MTLARLLDIRPGVTAVIGSGGKTTLLRMLGEELAEAGGRVLLCTTTKILPFPGLPCACDRAELDGLAASRLLCAGMPLENGKLTVPEIPMAELAARYLFNQADTPERWEWARRCGECLPWPWAGASLKNGVYFDGCAHKGGGGETICWL